MADEPQGSTPPAHPHGIRRLTSIPGLRALLLFIVAITLSWQYAKASFYRDPGSRFYDESRAFTRWYSAQREFEGDMFINTALVAANAIHDHENGTHGFAKAGVTPSMCASFATVGRDIEKQYIDASIGSLLEGMTRVEREDFHLKVLFATRTPQDHPTYKAPWLPYIVDEAISYRDIITDTAEMEMLERFAQEGKSQEKGILDYTYALDRCYQSTNASYIAIFEDDVVVAEGWFAKTMFELTKLQDLMATRSDPNAWLFMRLFNQERSIGWFSHDIGANHEQWISLGIGTTLLGFLLILRSRSRGMRTFLDNWTVFVVCCLAVPAFVILFFQSGKASLLPPSAGLHEEGFGCCSQAMIFNREQVPGLISFLRNEGSGQYDLLTMNYAAMNNLARFALYPIQIQHIGIRSARATSNKEAQAVWSAAFETLDSTQLRRQHLRLVDHLYGHEALLNDMPLIPAPEVVS